MLNDFGDSKITVKKATLLEAIKKNRETHSGTFARAQEGYRVAAIKEIDAMLSEARTGGDIRRSVTIVQPVEHTKDYDRVIRMLEMSIADEVTVTETQFSQYVLDEWGWSREFVNSTSRYTGR